MRKWMKTCLLLAMVLALATGCSLIYKDPEVDKQTVVLEVNGRAYLKGEVQQMIAEEMEYQQYMYSYQYGATLDVNDPEVIAFVQDTVFDTLVQQEVVKQKLEDGGYLQLTEEEEKTAQESAWAQYDAYVEEILAYQLAESELTEEEKLAEAERLLAEQGYPTREELLESERLALADEKLYQETVKDAAVTEEELRAAYNDRVAVAKADYEYDPSYFTMDVKDGATIYYRPAGYRYVKHILLALSDEDGEKIAALEEKLFAAQEELSALQLEREDPQAEWTEELTAKQQEAEAALFAAEEELAAAREAAYAALQPKVEEVQAAIAAGEDFDSLIETYGEDDGMTAEPARNEGYMVSAASTDYVQAFVEGAMALSALGDVSEPVRSEYGVHIIRYVGDVQEGEVPFEEVKDAIGQTALEEKQSVLYQEAVMAWVAEADVKMYKNRMD
jgi:parvulin-like peptidyl-prolyl isomerase